MTTFNKLKDFTHKIDDESIVLVCVLRNESLILPAFIQHYKQLKVSHFIFIDNDSSDDTRDYLLSLDLNSQIWHTSQSYSKNKFGVQWVENILNDQCINKWCVVVDADEFLALETQSNLIELREEMISNDSTVTVSCLIDFYPIDFNDKVTYTRGDDPQNHSCYYDRFTNMYLSGDKGGPHTWHVGPRNDWNTIFFLGGLRNRIVQNKVVHVALNKRVFYKFDPQMKLWPGMHTFSVNNRLPKPGDLNFKYHEEILVLKHFKYHHPDIYKYFQYRVDRNQDWNNSAEYKQYIDNKYESYIHDDVSIKYSTIDNVYQDTVYHLKNWWIGDKKYKL